ncbi:MAG: zinc ribbon domain-containing protein [Gemmatimonadales bacterium]|jgi:predicted  nucleic acid-binding Zn-ribbon protein
MHADLVKLLDLQAKDAVVADVERRLEALRGEFTTLDQALDQARAGLEAARRTVVDASRRRDELEAKIESYRLLQERRRLRLEHVRNPKEASALMAELDLARSVVAKEENDWIRSAETVTQLERKVSEEERNVEQVGEGQAPERARLDARRAELEAELATANATREEAAAQLDRQLRTRYERLRKSRLAEVVVPLVSNGCGACHTAVPLNRRSQIRSGAVIEGCEACGAILYPPEEARSAR